MPKLLSVIGTRPEAIKMAPVLAAYQKSRRFKSEVLLSGQHVRTPAEILTYFDVSYTADLFLMRHGASLNTFFSRALKALDLAMARLVPDAVAVHGDTATAAAAAFAAFHRNIPVFHIEAGLRTGDLSSPFPEEFYRIMIDRIAALCFAPTEQARENLLSEGTEENRIFVTGNTAVDALRHAVRSDFRHPYLEAANGKKLVIATLHRRENRGVPFENMCRAIKDVMAAREDALLLFVMHPDPVLQRKVREIFGGMPHIIRSAPLAYPVFQNLLARCTLLLTDSGGLQEEACTHGIPALVLRDKSERSEGFARGCLIPVGTDRDNIMKTFSKCLDAPPARMPDSCFGDGNAAVRILFHTERYFR